MHKDLYLNMLQLGIILSASEVRWCLRTGGIGKSSQESRQGKSTPRYHYDNLLESQLTCAKPVLTNHTLHFEYSVVDCPWLDPRCPLKPLYLSPLHLGRAEEI